ncbi:MAG: glutamate 5-kinase [Dehalococcoidales bacterium]|jgi:glutamate 5-kinase|nr:glutamate 5-kinase [Dehalococcoidales bacterium]
MKSSALPYRRIVIKLGSNLLTSGRQCLDVEMMASLVLQIAALHKQGLQIIMVTSGAIAAGRYKLGKTDGIKGIPYKQVLAAVGQARLMNVYEELFDRHDIVIAQALLTKADMSDRLRYLNARNTLLNLLDLNIIGIINENDVVAVDELHETRFGDNDNLSAMVANLVDADLLLLLTDIDGLYTADPRRNPDATLIKRVEKITTEIEGLAGKAGSTVGTGGMITKIEAARLATSSGIPVIIANGHEPKILQRIAGGEEAGTLFVPTSKHIDSRKRWMVSGLSVKGKLAIDEGAANALKQKNSSLLAAGIRASQGKYQRGDIVNILDAEGVRIGCGITNYGSTEVETIMGVQSKQIASLLGHDYGAEVIHRNNLIIL